MGRPKSSKPHKQHMNLTVSEETRLLLEFVSNHEGQSISELVASWAEREAKRIVKRTGGKLPTPPPAEQITLFDK